MSESRIKATDRLRREGRWDEATTYRDEMRRQFKREGKSREEAVKASWQAMLEKYPPLAEPESNGEIDMMPDDEETGDIDALLDRVDSGAPDLVRDVIWSYENLENPRARPADAPSLGAWGLLKWARGDRDHFFERMLSKAMAAKVKGAESAPASDDPDLEDLEAEIRRMMGWNGGVDKKSNDSRADWERDLIAKAPAKIWKRVRGVVANWARSVELELSADAVDGLALQMTEVATNCMAAALRNPDGFPSVLEIGASRLG
jgi:hypothetical protein